MQHQHSKVSCTSAEFIVGTVAVEVVALAVFAAVAFLGIVPLLALTGAAHALAVVAADVCTVVLAAVLVQVLGGHLVLTTFTLSANTSLIAPERNTVSLLCVFTHSENLHYNMKTVYILLEICVDINNKLVVSKYTGIENYHDIKTMIIDIVVA